MDDWNVHYIVIFAWRGFKSSETITYYNVMNHISWHAKKWCYDYIIIIICDMSYYYQLLSESRLLNSQPKRTVIWITVECRCVIIYRVPFKGNRLTKIAIWIKVTHITAYSIQLLIHALISTAAWLNYSNPYPIPNAGLAYLCSGKWSPIVYASLCESWYAIAEYISRVHLSGPEITVIKSGQ